MDLVLAVAGGRLNCLGGETVIEAAGSAGMCEEVAGGFTGGAGVELAAGSWALAQTPKAATERRRGSNRSSRMGIPSPEIIGGWNRDVESLAMPRSWFQWQGHGASSRVARNSRSSSLRSAAARRSGRLAWVLARAAWRRQRRMAAWSPPARTSGMGAPRKSAGRV